MHSLRWVAAAVPESAKTEWGRSSRRRVRWGGILLLFLALTVRAAAWAQDSAKEARRQRLQRFIESHPTATPHRDAQGFLEGLEGTLSAPLAGRSPVDVVYAFLDTNKELFGLTDPRGELKALGSGERDRFGVRHLKFQRLYKGLEVLGGIVGVHFNRQDVLDRIDGTFCPQISLPTTPVISREAALEIVAKDMKDPVGSLDVRKAQLLVYPRDSSYYLAWHFIVNMGGEYFIDALTGRVIYHWDMIMRGKPRGDAPVRDSQPQSAGEMDSRPLSGDSLVRKPVIRVFPYGKLLVDSLRREPITPSPPPPQSKGAASWETICSEGFEGDFPSSSPGWTVDGDPTWDDDDCKHYGGAWSAWCANGGAHGVDPCASNYLNNDTAWMVFGPFALCDATDADLSFWYWLNTEQDYDWFCWLTSTDGTYFQGNGQSGNSGGWQPMTVSLATQAGNPTVWVAFLFESDASVTGSGVYVDNVLIRKNHTGGRPDLVCYGPAGWEGPIVVSNTTGTRTTNTVMLGAVSYIDFAWANLGANCAGYHVLRLLFDGSPIASAWAPYLDAGYYTYVEDIPYTFTVPGSHTLRLTVDADGQVVESNESNNACEMDVIVACNAGHASGQGCGVMGDTKQGVKTERTCGGSAYLMRDLTRIAVPNAIETFSYDGTLPGVMLSDDNNVWEDPWECPAVDAHVYTGWTFDYMRDSLGRNSFDSGGASMISTVEYYDAALHGDTFCPDNAIFYRPTQRMIVCTPSSGHLSFTGALDVIAHEWAHGVTMFASDLAYEKESGALNESFSDMMGVSLGFAYNDPDWLIGENYGSVLRDMEHPTSHNQPDTYKGQYWFWTENCTPPDDDYCGVHTNSGVPNKMFYLLAHGGQQNGYTVAGIGVHQAMRVMYRANASEWKPDWGFTQAFAGCVQAAYDINPSGQWASQVRLASLAVGICDCPCHADPVCDGVIKVTDVVKAVDVAFRGEAKTLGALCPYALTDVDCTGVTDVNDVVRLVNVAFRGGTKKANFRNPCP